MKIENTRLKETIIKIIGETEYKNLHSSELDYEVSRLIRQYATLTDIIKRFSKYIDNNKLNSEVITLIIKELETKIKVYGYKEKIGAEK